MAFIDTNVTLSRWPFRRLPQDTPAALAEKLRGRGISEAWAASFDALLHRDMCGVNRRLAALCAQSNGLLTPFGTANPTLPDWEEDVRRCHEEFRMPGLRLYPNYHQYTLESAEFRRLLDLATSRGLIVQIAALMEDERTQHPLVRVPHVDVTPLVGLLKDSQGHRIQLLNWHRPVPAKTMLELIATEQVWFDLATLEGVGGIEKLLTQMPVERLLFGSHAPLFVLESALLKLKESALTEGQLAAICGRNAEQLKARR